MSYFREATRFVVTLQQMMAGTHKVDGKRVKPALPARHNQELLLTVGEVFAPMMDDFELYHPMSDAVRTSFTNRILAHVVESGLNTRERIQALEPDSVRLGMLFHFKPELINSDHSIRALLSIHAHLLALATMGEPWLPRQLLATFSNLYHLERLTEPYHFKQEASVCGHCVAEMVRVWQVDPGKRKELRYGELAYHRLVLQGGTHILSFGDRTGPLTTIQFNTEHVPEYAMLGPKFAKAHTGRERYFHYLVDGMAWFARHHGIVYVQESHSISRVLIDALLNHPVGRYHIRTRNPFEIERELRARLRAGLIG